MGVQGNRQLRAALGFVLRPLLIAVVLTVFVRVFFGGSKTSSAYPPPQLPKLKPNANSEPAKPQPVFTEPANIQQPAAVAENTHLAAAADNHNAGTRAGRAGVDSGELTKALIVAETSDLPAHDIAWLDEVPGDWAVYRYVADAPQTPELAVPLNKGNEAMIYLTYIVDHYNELPDVVLFHHAHRRGWHQAMDSLEEVQRLRPQYVAKRGYASLRCLPNCENIIELADYAVDQARFADRGVGRDVQLTTLLDDFLDKDRGERVPKRLASPCCAQFAASREAIQRRPRAWWRALRQWLIDTPLRSQASGRLLEHTWHVWLGNESYHCPTYEACRCHVFGLGECESYFALEDTM